MTAVAREDVWMFRFPVLLLCGVVAVATAAELAVEEQEVDEAAEQSQRIYRTVDQQGQPVFTDAPDHRVPVQEIEIRQQNMIPMVVPRIKTQPPLAVEAIPDYKLAITSPENETTMHNPESLTVAISVNPAPAKGHTLRLLNNGEETSRHIEWPNRGEHRFVAQILDDSGKVLVESAPVIVYIHRASILNR
jgi:hypothetical protein